MATNRQLWHDGTGAPGTIREAPIPNKVDDGQILIKVSAWAMNPCDSLLSDTAWPSIKYPIILGQDIAGVVELVDPKAGDRFKVGDRVLGFSVNNGFQEHVVLEHILAAKIPDNVSFAGASVFGLAISTSSFLLFGKDCLGLPPPALNPISTGKSVLVWGGSSALGCNAIQLLKASGFEVITTCSPKNFDYVKSLGASKAFDYNSPYVIDDVVAELDKGVCAGIYLAAGKVADACQVSHKSKQKIFVASSNPVQPDDVPEGVETQKTFRAAKDLYNEAYETTWKTFFPEALAKGLYKVTPQPDVVSKKGLDGIQEALGLMKKGISAKKLVVESS